MKRYVQCMVMMAVIAGFMLAFSCGGMRQVDGDHSIMQKISDEESDAAGGKNLGEPSSKKVADDISRSADKKGGKAEGSIGKDKELYSFGSGGDKPGKADGVSGLKAGFADDNKQFNYFIDFMLKYGSTMHIPVNVAERIILKLKDAGNRSLPNADVKIYDKNKLVFSGKTYSDGSFPFFPSEYGTGSDRFRAVITHGKSSQELDVMRYGKREVDIMMQVQREAYQNVPLDILFIFDTTGSMGEEIARLKRTVELIYLNLSSLPSQPRVRFGMVLYKDRGDEYVTRVIPLTKDLDKLQQDLNQVNASGGGDLPEDMQSALESSMTGMNWDPQGIRLCFVVTDAPPHLDYGQQYNYYSAMKDARKLGIKIFSVGTGGLTLAGEFVMRQISQYTSAKYIFLTYGETGESAGGAEGSVSHHTGANFQTDKLETIIMRFARDEIYNLSKEKEQADEEFFSANKIGTEKSEETLQKLFSMAASQLADYSALNIKSKTPTTVLPLHTSDAKLKLNAEYFTEQMIFSLSKSGAFSLVERKNLQGILKELELSMTGLVEEENAAKVGKVLGAKLIVTGSLYGKGGNYEIFLKLLRVETAEVLSVTKAKIDKGLGLSSK